VQRSFRPDTHFGKNAAGGNRIAVGMRPQWLTASLLLGQLLSLAADSMADKAWTQCGRENGGRGYGDYGQHATGAALFDSGARNGCSACNQGRARSVPLCGSRHDSGWDWNETDAAMRGCFTGSGERRGKKEWLAGEQPGRRLGW